MRTIKTYDGLNNSYGVHAVKVSLQDQDYHGAFTCKTYGNCKGMDILSFHIGDYDSYDLNNLVCEAGTTICRNDEDEEIIQVTLTREDGDTCEYDVVDEELMRMVVGVQIVEFGVYK